MIFVTLGTQDKSFNRLLEEVDSLIEKKVITDKVVVQSGYTKYNSKNMEIHDYIDMEEFDKYLSKADLIICHGGVGSILGAINKKKKVIAVPRLQKYNEHINDHQLQIIDNFNKMEYIIGCEDVKDLKYALKRVDKFKPKPYKSNKENMCNLIERLIED